MVELGLFFGSVLSRLYKSVSVSMFVQMNTHDCFVSIVKLPVCASVSQEQRSSCEEPGRCPNSGPHLCHICLPVPSRCVNLPPWHLFTCGTTLHLTGRRASTLPPHLVPQGICHSPVISFINSWFPPTFLHQPQRKREREPSERKW